MYSLINRFNYTNANYRSDSDNFNPNGTFKDLINNANTRIIGTKAQLDYTLLFRRSVSKLQALGGDIQEIDASSAHLSQTNKNLMSCVVSSVLMTKRTHKMPPL